MLRDNLPRYSIYVKIQPPVKRDIIYDRKLSKSYHDKHTSQPPKTTVFQSGQLVAIQDPATKEWTRRGRIIKMVAPRSYEVNVGQGKILRWNRQAIRRLHVVISASTLSKVPIEVETPIGNTSLSSTIPYEEEEVSDTSFSSTIPYDEEE